jgi:acetylornithine/N-succinyldiaminopimelate aminotransferase
MAVAKKQKQPNVKELEIQELEKNYLIQTYARYPLVIQRGRGCWVYDMGGRKYLDFVGGLAVNALGHAHPRIVKVIREQAARALHVSNLYYHPYQGPLAQRLARLSGLDRAFFCNSGTEAIEAALKLARAYSGKPQEKFHVVALENSFHGRTMGALAATHTEKYRVPFQPLIPGVDFARFNDVESLRACVNERTSALLLEPIQGEGGVYELSAEFLREAEELARRFDALLIVDEIQCGLGRTGDWFAFQRAGIKPDVVVVAKPMAAGLPLGAVLAREHVAAAFSAGMHGTTFGGGPLACRVALEFLDVVEQNNLLEHVNTVGDYFHRSLMELKHHFPFVSDVRGRGLMLAIELEFPTRSIVLEALQAGLLVNSTHDTALRFLPPFIATEQDVDHAVRILHRILASGGFQQEISGV